MLKSIITRSLVAASVLGAAAMASAQVGYTFDLTTHYQFGGSDVNSIGGNPDTGFITFANDGSSDFTGTLTLQNDGGSFLLNSWTGTVLAGGSITLAATDEGSNQGGFGPNGALYSIVGSVSQGVNGPEAVNLGVHDGDIHSGVPNVSPCDGLVSDSFVLQGGSPAGCDNGDNYEVAQADGHFRFSEQAVPEPASLAVLGLGVGAFLLMRRK